jgi:hypothetical protein
MNHTSDFPPLTPRQLELLEAIKAEKEKLRSLPPWDPKTGTWVPEFYEIQEKIDDLSVKALASGLMKNRPAESRRPGKFIIEVPTCGGRLLLDGKYKISPGFSDFHPDLPSWAKDHFFEWIMMVRSGIRRPDGHRILRKTKIVGIETGMNRLKDMIFLKRVLELRGYAVTDEMLKQREAKETKRTRTRKEDRPWWRVIEKLVEDGLVKKVKTPSGNEKNPSVQAFKKMLKNRYPLHPWDET